MASHRQPRPPRKRGIGTEPVPLSSLRTLLGDTSEVERIDGFSGVGEVRAPRRRSRHTEPLNMSVLDFAETFVGLAPLWEMADEYEKDLQAIYTVGRKRKCRVADVLVYQLIRKVLPSVRAVHRFLDDPRTWQALVAAAERHWPDHPERRLSPEATTRFQYIRTLDSLTQRVPDLRERHRDATREAAVKAARLLGCGQDKDSLTHPSKKNIIMGDATWEQSLYNGLANRIYADEITGEIFTGRSDPDAKPFHGEGSAPGNFFVSVLIRTEHEHERIILDSQYKPDGLNDGTVFTDMAFKLFEPLGNVRGVIYDMALKAADQDRVGATGRHVLCKVPHTKGDRIRSEVVGEHTFKNEKKSFTEVVTAIDGCPTIVVSDISGEKHVVPLTRKQTKLNKNLMYNVFQIPDDPIVPLSKRGATTLIRMFSSEADIAAGKPRPRYLRSIPLNDPDFSRLYGLREDTESMHNDYKSRLLNRRAGSVGLARREMDIRGYQMFQMVVALMAWKIRTGGDVSEFLGQWEPPERARRRNDA